MRPITITVLSDYGRDGSLYYSFETLFEPFLEPEFLPIKNIYILKLNVFAFFD